MGFIRHTYQAEGPTEWRTGDQTRTDHMITPSKQTASRILAQEIIPRR
jgi:hypothetical protein